MVRGGKSSYESSGCRKQRKIEEKGRLNIIYTRVILSFKML